MDELDDMANDPDIQRELAAIRAEEQGHAGMYQDSNGNWRTLDALYGSEPEHPADVRHETENALRDENARLRAALEAIANLRTVNVYDGWLADEAQKIAREALAERRSE